MATIIVAYPAQDGSHFDESYFREFHVPLVEKAWGPHGFTGAEVLAPAGDQPFKMAILLRFRDQAAIDAALAAPDTAEVMGDVANYTNIAPTVYRAGD